MKFERKWGDISGQRFLYVRPKTAVSDNDWMAFFESELANYQDDLFLVLVDVVEIEDDIGFKGFSHIAETLKGCNIHRACFAVLPSDAYYPVLGRLFENLAVMKGLDLKVQLFERRDAAEAWLGRQ